MVRFDLESENANQRGVMGEKGSQITLSHVGARLEGKSLEAEVQYQVVGFERNASMPARAAVASSM